MGSTMILNERLEVDVLAPSLGQPPIENLGRLVRGLSPFVGLERPLDDFGHGSFLAPRERMREVARSGAADGKLRLGHGGIPSSSPEKIIRRAPAIKPSTPFRARA
jgi:hypothetical protein